MDWKTKTGVIGAIILVFCALIFVLKLQHDTINKLKFIETSVVESKTLNDGLVRAQASYVTKKDLEQLLKENNIKYKDLKKDLNTLGADLQAINTISVATPGLVLNNVSSSSTGETNPSSPAPGQPVPDPHGYFSTQQWRDLTEPFGDGTVVPFGRAGFSAWQEKPWSIEILPREYKAVTVLAENEEGRHYAYSKFQIEVDGKNYVVPISEAKIVEKYPNSKFRFSPRVYLGVNAGGVLSPPAHGEVTPDVEVSLFSYGKTKVSPDWSFAGVGIGYATQTPAAVIVVAPVNYNVGKPLPLMDNFHVGPAVSFDKDGGVGLYLGGKVGF